MAVLRTTPDVMGYVTEAYLAECSERRRRPTRAGLALALGYTSVSDFDRQRRVSEEWDEAVSHALLQIEAVYEENLHGTNSTGAQFALCNINSTGWRQASQIDHRSGDGSMTPTRITRRIIDPQDESEGGE